VSVLVRSWNLFHGNAKPPERRAYLEDMVLLATSDRPDVVCLQEVPAWALSHLGPWSGMQAFGRVAQRPRIGPVPTTATMGRAITSLHHGLFRSAFAGQANAILLAAGIHVHADDAIVLNPRSFRREQARRLGLDLVARLAWAKERRVCQALRVSFPDGHRGVVANLHATSYPADRRLADAELFRAAVFVDSLTEPGELCVLAGDFNIAGAESETMRALTQREWAFSRYGAGIDQILVRGARASEPERWPEGRRRLGGRLLSDHAPVEVRIS
jgi:endonuclease/exonuclease/phosphatase family metal-dependent hydrolase